MLVPQSLKPAGYTIASLVVSVGGVLNGYLCDPLLPLPSSTWLADNLIHSYDTGSVGSVVLLPIIHRHCPALTLIAAPAMADIRP